MLEQPPKRREIRGRAVDVANLLAGLRATTAPAVDPLSLEGLGITEEEVIAYAESLSERREARLAKGH